MRLLILTNRLARPGDSTWLIDDLVSELRREACTVDVVVADQARPRPRGVVETGRGRDISVGPNRTRFGRIRRMGEIVVAAGRIRRMVREVTREGRYDGLLFPSIACQYGGAGRVAAHAGVPAAMILWDFFPTHQIQIGRLPAAAGPLLKVVERWSIGRPSVLFLMSQGNIDFLDSYHPDVPGRRVILPPWAGDVPCRASGDGARFRVVFGGQLTHGRGVETLIDAAAVCSDRGVDLEVVVAGSGPMEDEYRRRALMTAPDAVVMAGQLSRDHYGQLLAAAHVGVAATVSGASIPSFPSKIGDYARVGLPILVATEEASDVGALVEGAGAGVSVPAGQPRAMADALCRLETLHREGGLQAMGARARDLFEARLSAAAAARVVMAAFSDP